MQQPGTTRPTAADLSPPGTTAADSAAAAGPHAAPRHIVIDHLELDLRGYPPGVAEAAVQALPAQLLASLSGPAGQTAGAATLAQTLAERIAQQIAARRGGA